MTRVLVTGGTGFVGATLCGVLSEAGLRVRVALRSQGARPAAADESVVVGNIDSATDWSEALRGVDAVIHAAARAHVLHDSASNDGIYAETNERGTMRLAQGAVTAGVQRFVFVSSVKVNGDATYDEPFRATDLPRPQDAYARSKWAAEQRLAALSAAQGLPIAIVRAPLVYGPGVKANFRRLLRWADSRMPLPFGAIANRRSLVSVWNLSDLLATLVNHPDACGQTWMVSDGEDLSTPELVLRLAAALGRRPRLFRFPVVALRAAGVLTGRSAEIARLCGSLLVDSSPVHVELGWRAPIAVDEALRRTAEWYRREAAARGLQVG